MADQQTSNSMSTPCWVVLDETGKPRRVYLEKPADEAKALAWIYREDVPGEQSGLLMPRDGIEAKAAGYHLLECRVVRPTPEPPPEQWLEVQNAMAYLRTMELACDARDDRQSVTYIGQIRALLHRLSRGAHPPGPVSIEGGVMVKNGYCTDCGGINEHYDHCLSKQPSPPPEVDRVTRTEAQSWVDHAVRKQQDQYRELFDIHTRATQALERVVDHYDTRSELYTSDAECAAGLADITRNWMQPPKCSDCEAGHPRDADGFHLKASVLTLCSALTKISEQP